MGTGRGRLERRVLREKETHGFCKDSGKSDHRGPLVLDLEGPVSQRAGKSYW